MVCIYLPAAYYHFNLDVTKENCWRQGFLLSQRSFFFTFVILNSRSTKEERHLRVEERYSSPALVVRNSDRCRVKIWGRSSVYVELHILFLIGNIFLLKKKCKCVESLLSAAWHAFKIQAQIVIFWNQCWDTLSISWLCQKKHVTFGWICNDATFDAP